jgi:integrase
LRHTAATRAQRAVGNLKTVQRMLGHKDIKTTLRHVRSDVADVRAAMEAVEEATLGPRAVGEEEKKAGGSNA